MILTLRNITAKKKATSIDILKSSGLNHGGTRLFSKDSSLTPDDRSNCIERICYYTLINIPLTLNTLKWAATNSNEAIFIEYH